MGKRMVGGLGAVFELFASRERGDSLAVEGERTEFQRDLDGVASRSPGEVRELVVGGGLAPEGVGHPYRIVDLDFNVLATNREMERVAGDEVPAKCYDQFCSEELCGSEECPLERLVVDGESSFEGEYRFEGSRFLVTAAPIRDGSGDVVAVGESLVELPDFCREGGVDESVDELVEGARGMAELTQGLSGSAEEQVDSMQEAFSEVNNLADMVEDISDKIYSVYATSNETEEMADEAQEASVEAEQAMADLEGATEELSEDLKSLKSSLEEVDEFTGAIRGIAEETNLLALNASIEATHAGEKGDGFNVVAEEVKSLSDDSREKADNIEELVDEIENEADGTMESLGRASERVSEGVEVVEEVCEKLSLILSSIEETADGLEEIASVTESYASSSEEVTSKIERAAANAFELTSKIDEATEKARRLNSDAEEVKGFIDEQNDRV